jgi:hypothetical protein
MRLTLIALAVSTGNEININVSDDQLDLSSQTASRKVQGGVGRLRYMSTRFLPLRLCAFAGGTGPLGSKKQLSRKGAKPQRMIYIRTLRLSVTFGGPNRDKPERSLVRVQSNCQNLLVLRDSPDNVCGRYMAYFGERFLAEFRSAANQRNHRGSCSANTCRGGQLTHSLRHLSG